jgi:hypothetical protein
MSRALPAFLIAFVAGCSLSLGLNGDADRPCPDGKCLDKYVCFKNVCVLGSGSTCKVAGDCPSGVCLDGGCQLAACADNSRNHRETDVDCGGGSCVTCKNGQRCLIGNDCSSKVCGLSPSDGGTADGGSSDGGTPDAGAADAGDAGSPFTCQPISCTDGTQNGAETDVDCGGDGGCPRCVNGLVCTLSTDCVMGNCVGVCQPGTCTDTVKNALETDIDCGGPCKKCDDGKGCLVGKDCVDGVCTPGVDKCAVPTCSDGVLNGTETDSDCGGGSCGGCSDTRVCKMGTDCGSGVCQNATCRPAHCGNGTRDVDESDKDCGGVCQKCGLAKSCSHDSDCSSDNCFSGYCIP